MTNPTGLLTIVVNSKEYRLWFCHLGIASLQEEFGNNFIAELDAPEGASAAWMPPLKITNGIIREAFKRYHSDALEADPYIVGDAIAQHNQLWSKIVNSAFPEVEPSAAGNAQKPKEASST